MTTKKQPAAERRRFAIEKGLALTRKLVRLSESEDTTPADKTDRADEIVEVSEQLAALFAEYPDVYPNPPVPVDTLRDHTRALKESNAIARRDEEALAEGSHKLEEAKRRLDVTLNEIARAPHKPGKPS
jgi:hypothetical protein